MLKMLSLYTARQWRAMESISLWVGRQAGTTRAVCLSIVLTHHVVNVIDAPGSTRCSLSFGVGVSGAASQLNSENLPGSSKEVHS